MIREYAPFQFYVSTEKKSVSCVTGQWLLTYLPCPCTGHGCTYIESCHTTTEHIPYNRETNNINVRAQ